MASSNNEPDHDLYYNNLLQTGHNFGMEVGNGMSVFGKVLKYEDLPNVLINRYTALATRTCESSYAGGAATAWNQWVNADNHKFFREEEYDKILQVHIGIGPSRLRLFREMPLNNPRGQLHEINMDTPARIDTPGYWDGLPETGSPLNTPSRRTEMIIPREWDTRFMLFNPERYSVMPLFNCPIRRCTVLWYNINKPSHKKMIENFCNFLYNNKGDPVHYWSPGNTNFSYGAKQNLNIEPVFARQIAGVE